VENCSAEVSCTEIPDVERNGFCFSDGVGRISPKLAILAALRLKSLWDDDDDDFGGDDFGGVGAINQRQRALQPSALQFRYKGCKGVLCVDERLEGLQMQLRPSQMKFPCPGSDTLEAIRIAQYLPGFMNREIILLLSCHGVQDRVFLGLQAAMTERMDAMLTNQHLALDVLYDIGAHGTVRSFVEDRVALALSLTSHLLTLHRLPPPPLLHVEC
jgi:RNA-dependent RNA polymerase